MRAKVKIALALILTLSLVQVASADWVTKLVESIMEQFIPWVVKLILYPVMLFSVMSIKAMLYYNPTAFCWPGIGGCTITPGLNALYPYVMNILVPVYVVALMFTALFFITKSGSPRGRVRARKMLFRLIMGMLFVVYSPMIYQAMIDISFRLTSLYLDQVSIDKIMSITSFGKGVAMCYLQFCMFYAFLVTLIILIARWFFVYIYGVFFPFIMFLYFFEITKPYGSKYLKQAIRWIFVPPLQALILYVLVLGPLTVLGNLNPTGLPAIVQSLFTQFVAIFIVLGGMITMCAAPMIMTQILFRVIPLLRSIRHNPPNARICHHQDS